MAQAILDKLTEILEDVIWFKGLDIREGGTTDLAERLDSLRQLHSHQLYEAVVELRKH